MPKAGPEWGPQRAQNGQITKNGPRCRRGGARKVPLSKRDKINLGTVWVAFWPCLDPCGPETVSVVPKMGSFFAKCVLRAETEKWPYLGLDGPNRESVDTALHMETPILGGFQPSEMVQTHR